MMDMEVDVDVTPVSVFSVLGDGTVNAAGDVYGVNMEATTNLVGKYLVMRPVDAGASAIDLQPQASGYANSALYINTPNTAAGTGFNFIDCRAAGTGQYAVNGQGDISGRSLTLTNDLSAAHGALTSIAATAYRGVQFDVATTVTNSGNVTFTPAQLLSGHIRRTGFTASSTITDTMPNAVDLILAIPEPLRVVDLAFNFHVYMLASSTGSGTYGWSMGTGGTTKSAVNLYSLAAPAQFFSFRIRITSLGTGSPSYTGATYDFFRFGNVNAV
jgi:hypothetical protein